MNRQQRRQKEREVKKNLDFLEKLTPEQLKRIDDLTRQAANVRIEEFGQMIDRSMSAVLIERDWTLDVIEKIQNRMSELLIEDTEKSQKLEKENVDVMKIEKEVREYIEGLLGQGLSKKQAMDDLIFKFPKLSKSMLLNAYAKVKEEKEEQEKITREKLVESAKKHGLSTDGKKKIADELGAAYSTVTTYISRWKITESDLGDKEVDEAAEKILSIIEGEEHREVKESKDTEEELKQKAEKIIETAKEMQCSDKKQIKEEVKMENKEVKGLKIKSMVVEGNNGIYKVCEEGIELTKGGLAMFFENEEQLGKFVAEFEQVFAMRK
ncbi:MAG: hypothetical protein E7211_09815 [Clostridium lundense]|nr:hypothetical protein [Clostridium lundense]